MFYAMGEKCDVIVAFTEATLAGFLPSLTTSVAYCKADEFVCSAALARTPANIFISMARLYNTYAAGIRQRRRKTRLKIPTRILFAIKTWLKMLRHTEFKCAVDSFMCV